MLKTKKSSTFEFFEGGKWDILDEDLLTECITKPNPKELSRHIYWGALTNDQENNQLVKALGFFSYLNKRDNSFQPVFQKAIELIKQEISDNTQDRTETENNQLIEFTEHLLLTEFFENQKNFQQSKDFFTQLQLS